MRQTQVIAITILITTIAATCTQNNFERISKDVDRIYRQGRQVKGPTSHDIRMEVFRSVTFPPLNLSEDTLFFLEQQNIEEGSFEGLIWNKKFRKAYRYTAGEITDPGRPFTKFTEALISKWDTTEIRAQEQRYAVSFPKTTVYATRVILHNGINKIDTIQFAKFLKVERDIDQ